ncbi:hypothetical protein N665_0093s0069 [Sinapis alba]|nr:hypothetical protein N665_0093s0069 [Sinapis alba]
MTSDNLLPILCFVLILSFGLISAQTCGDSMVFRPNSTYDINRRLILSTFASNVSSGNGMYNASVGEGPERIYALGMCIPGAKRQTCADCIQLASDGLLKNCPIQTDSFYWRADKTLCFVRYSNHSFLDQNDLEPVQTDSSSSDVTGDLAEYNRIWEVLMTRLISASSNLTVTVMSSLARKHYAVDIAPLSDFRTIYALMQCIPGLSSGECYDCLQANVRTYQGCCSGKQGGSIRRPVCFFRFESYPYLDAFDNISSPPRSSQVPQESQPPAPPPPPASPPPLEATTRERKTISTGVIVTIVVSTLILMALGYMAPEYAMHGQFSMKSDVYSFGVILLEIISGKMNSSFNQTYGSTSNLVTHAWRVWRKSSALELLDSTLGENYQSDEVTRCIHIALLCVQEDPEDRPMMSKIILLLTSNTITMPVPRAPVFFSQCIRDQDSEAEGSNSFGKPSHCSINDASITELEAR